MKVASLTFEERVVSLSGPNFKKVPPEGQVPALEDGDVCVWETLAILEYLNETFPAPQLWSADPTARADARRVPVVHHATKRPVASLPKNIHKSAPI